MYLNMNVSFWLFYNPTNNKVFFKNILFFNYNKVFDDFTKIFKILSGGHMECFQTFSELFQKFD